MPPTPTKIPISSALPGEQPATIISPTVISSKPAQTDYNNIKATSANLSTDIANQATNVSTQKATETTAAQAEADRQAKIKEVQTKLDQAQGELKLKQDALAQAQGTPVSSGAYQNLTSDEAQAIFGENFTGLTRNQDGTYSIDNAGIKTREGYGLQVPEGYDTSKGRILTADEKLQKSVDDNQAKIDNAALEFTNTIKNIQNGTIPLTEGEQAQVDALKNSYQQLIDEQSSINRSAIGSANIRGYQTGSAEYDPTFQNKTIGAIMTTGANKVAALNVQMAGAVANLTQAIKTNNINLAKSAYDTYNKTLTDRQTTLQDTLEKIQKNIADQQAAVEKQKVQSEMDTAIADLYSQGITDQASILKELKSSGINATASDVAAVLKNTGMDEINATLKEAASNGAPLEVLKAIGNAKSATEAFMLAGDYMQNPLDVAYKKAQIQKIYSDIENSGTSNMFGGDASQAIAYAQQYATTGQIPTGLPKGTFGIVSQIAKELPKQKGEIVSTTTGVKSNSIGTVAQDDFTRLYNIIQETEKLKKLDEERWGGVIAGTVGKVLGSDAQAKYLTSRKSIVDNIARMQSGAALTEEEVSFYEDYLPSRFSEKFGLGQDSLKKITNFEETMNTKLQNALSSSGLSIYGYSKVNIGGKEYTVGDTVTGSNGQSGRVNPDGSITLIN